MKVTVGVIGVKPFPKYMQSESGLIVLMTKDGCGIVTTGNEAHKFGYESTSWAMSCFTDVEEAEVAKVEKTFPKTMISANECVVFFEKPESGMCLKKGIGSNWVGEISMRWAMCLFKDFDLPVTLQND